MNTPKDAATMIAVSLAGLEVIQRLANVDDDAVTVLAAIRGVIVSIYEGFEGKTTPEVVLAEIEAFRATFMDKLAANDPAADAELEHKFEGR